MYGWETIKRLGEICPPVEDGLADLDVNVGRLLPVVPTDKGTRVAEDRRRALEARVHRAVVLVLHMSGIQS